MWRVNHGSNILFSNIRSYSVEEVCENEEKEEVGLGPRLRQIKIKEEEIKIKSKNDDTKK